MAIEIELKYLIFCNDTAEKITNLLIEKKIEFEQSLFKLSNCYFDTPDLNLRKHDMGLRIREKNGVFEQTIKTSGKVVGGLHQRPEYNVSITEKRVELALFPDEIWASTQSVDTIQAQIISLFTTDFNRTRWLVSTNNGSTVEIVFDQGDIFSGRQSEEICEIELELISGDVSELFMLAELLFSVLQLRPGIKSKAARGYALWHQAAPSTEHLSLEFMPYDVNESVQQAFFTGLTFLLQRLQITIDSYLAQPSLDYLADINEILTLQHHGFWLFEQYLSPEILLIDKELSHFIHLFSWVDNAIYLQELTNKTGNYRKKLELNHQLVEEIKLEKRRFPTEDDVKALIHDERFNNLQLSLLKLLVLEPDNKASSLLTNNKLNDFAETALAKSLADLVAVMPDALSLTSEQYLGQSKLLNRSLHTGSWLGSLYDVNERMRYRAPWLDIQQGLIELQTLWIIQQQLQKLAEQPAKLVDWQNSKVDNLLHALDHSRHKALSIKPYWEY